MPVVVCTALSFLTFFVQSDKIDTRLQLVVTLFLALVALQFVMEDDLPRASYVLPTRQLVITSYAILAMVAIETLIVYNVAHYDHVLDFIRGHQEARKRRAELYRQARRDAGFDSRSIFRALHLTSLTKSFRFNVRTPPDNHRGQFEGLPVTSRSAPGLLGPCDAKSVERSNSSASEMCGHDEKDVAIELATQSQIPLVHADAAPSPALWKASIQKLKEIGRQKSHAHEKHALSPEDRKWFLLWLAWVIDMVSFCLAVICYTLTAVLIFLCNGKK
eukprot:jgi/Botrbrau1/10699/Bobra.357_1s0003.1